MANKTKQQTLDRLSRIAPLWADVLKERSLDGKTSQNLLREHRIGNKKLHIGNVQCCIVGEAHGFRREYEDQCEVCYWYSMLFGLGTRYRNLYGDYLHESIILKSEIDWLNYLNEFMDHFEQVHRK